MQELAACEVACQDGSSQRSADFIDLFLDAESSDVINADTYGDRSFDRAAKIERKLSTDEVIAMCLVFLVAGFDTTANSLACTCYYLACAPEQQARLQEEIDHVCPGDAEPTYEQLNRLKFADACMKETLRLCPIAAL